MKCNSCYDNCIKCEFIHDLYYFDCDVCNNIGLTMYYHFMEKNKKRIYTSSLSRFDRTIKITLTLSKGERDG